MLQCLNILLLKAIPFLVQQNVGLVQVILHPGHPLVVNISVFSPRYIELLWYLLYIVIIQSIHTATYYPTPVWYNTFCPTTAIYQPRDSCTIHIYLRADTVLSVVRRPDHHTSYPLAEQRKVLIRMYVFSYILPVHSYVCTAHLRVIAIIHRYCMVPY
jgi:hypothetical protein